MSGAIRGRRAVARGNLVTTPKGFLTIGTSVRDL